MGLYSRLPVKLFLIEPNFFSQPHSYLIQLGLVDHFEVVFVLFMFQPLGVIGEALLSLTIGVSYPFYFGDFSSTMLVCGTERFLDGIVL